MKNDLRIAINKFAYTTMHDLIGQVQEKKESTKTFQENSEFYSDHYKHRNEVQICHKY
jgi:hypothetical protein